MSETFGQALKRLGYTTTVGAGPFYFQHDAPKDKKYTFGHLNTDISFPSSLRYFQKDQEVKGRLEGGEAINATAISNAIKFGAFPGFTDEISDLDMDALNDAGYVYANQDVDGVPQNIWDAIVVPADEAWVAQHPDGAGTGTTPSYPDLRPLVASLKTELLARKVALIAIPIPAQGGGRPAHGIHDEIAALTKMLGEIDKAPK